MRLKSSMSRADKELQFYKDKAEFADKISKIEERRAKKASAASESESEEE